MGLSYDHLTNQSPQLVVGDPRHALTPPGLSAAVVLSGSAPAARRR
jgi:hypothetical protein